MAGTKSDRRILIRRTVLAVPLWLLWLILVLLFFKMLPSLPLSDGQRKAEAVKHLLALQHAVHHQHAAERMQEIFPEGACFTVTLYALSWTNLINNFDVGEDLRETAIAEATWALQQYDQPYVVRPFTNTQVRNGVFWLGQRNLVLGQFLRALPETRRPAHLVDEFHRNTQALADAFLASPTVHLDAYPGLSWPVDNVTALASLLLHDKLYATSYRTVYERWRDWTRDHCDPRTGMPAGHLDSQTGVLLQPARGCTNSWILTLLPEMDPEYSAELYRLYRKHFLIRRFGFDLFREYPNGCDLSADVDTGPIILDVGTTATGVGLAAATANGDLKTAEDIYDLVNTFGLRRNVDLGKTTGTDYLLGQLPVADAFLTWAFTLRIHHLHPAGPRSLLRRVWDRKLLLTVFAVFSALVFWHTGRLTITFLRRRQAHRSSDPRLQ